MPSFTLDCECGQRFHTDERALGRRITCHCGRAVDVRPPTPASGGHAKTVFLPPERAKSTHHRRRRRRRHSRGADYVSRVRAAVEHAIAYPDVVALFSLGYLLAAGVIATLMWTLGDHWWLATLLVFMGRWVFLLPLILLVPLAAVLSRRSLIPLALTALILVGPVMGFQTGWRRWLPQSPGPHLRVVTYNVNGGTQFVDDLARLLGVWQPDVVALQECGPALARYAQTIQGWYHHDTQDLCLLSRFPINEVSVMDRRALEAVKQDAAGIGGAGLVVRYVIQSPYGRIGVTNLHLETARKGFEWLMARDLPGFRENTQLRDVESNLARRWVNQGLPAGLTSFIVLGDFNTPIESRIFEDHWGDLPDAFSTAGFGLGITRYNGWIRMRIDHVLLGPRFRADRVSVGDDERSDHRPVIADLTLQPQD